MWYFAAGDAGFYFSEQLNSMQWLPQLWYPEYGFGISALTRLWFDYPYQLFVKILYSIGLSWFIIDKILWLGMFLLAFYSAYKIAVYLTKSPLWAVLSAIIYSTNTYILLLFSGGQIGIALAYAFSPFVLLRFIQLNGEIGLNFPEIVRTGLWFALLIAFDLRIAFLVLAASGLFYFISAAGIRMKPVRILSFLFPILISVLVHLFWILPVIAGGNTSLSLTEEFTNPGMLNFLSFADFSHSMSLLHPNWPENLFGKVYFLQPEYIILPALAFSYLFFVNMSKQKTDSKPRYIIFFSFLSLLGIFLAKGVNDPFKHIYNWLFIHLPGFTMFRDPTKFYLYIALGYSILIPYTLHSVSNTAALKQRKFIFFILFLFFWTFTLRQVFLGRVTGNFKPPVLKSDYVRFKDDLRSDFVPSRVLWIPLEDSFAYFSPTHPLLRSQDIFKTSSAVQIIESDGPEGFKKQLTDAGVGYVVVPIDIEKKIFLEDYKFNPAERTFLISILGATDLIRVEQYSDLVVFKNTGVSFIQNKPKYIAYENSLSQIGLGFSCFFLIASMVYLNRSKTKVIKLK